MEIQIFKNDRFGEVRTMVINGEPWFVGKDVASVLGYVSPHRAVFDHVDEDDKTSVLIQHSGSNYKSKTIFINESGLYSLILSSKLPQAKEFKRWVTNEVLPQIRKTGGYIPLNDCEDTGEIMARALMIAQRTIEQKDALLEMQKPKVRFAEAVTGSDDSILIGELAKLITQNGYEIGRTRLFDWLRRNGYIFKNSTEPIQKWVEKGLFETKVSIIHTHHGEHEVLTTKVTGKGQRYFIDVFLSKKL
jgi:anti-repressor protein